MRRRGVVLIVAPGDLGKPRPAIVVQAGELGDSTSTLLVCPMSSDISEVGALRPTIEPTDSNGLRRSSQIMTDKLVALRRDRLRTVLGHLDAQLMEQVDTALLVVLGLAR